MRPLYKVWSLSSGGWWWKHLSDYPNRVEFDWVESWPRTLASVSDATLSLLPPTVAAFIATDAGKRTQHIRHVPNPAMIMRSSSLVLTEKEWIDLMERMNTLCFPWEVTRCGMRESSSLLGQFCPFCGSAIVVIRLLRMLDSISDTTSSNGRNCYQKIEHVSYSLTMESPNANRKWLHALTPIPTRWLSTQTTNYGKSISWRAAGGKCGHTYITSQLTTAYVEIEPVNR